VGPDRHGRWRRVAQALVPQVPAPPFEPDALDALDAPVRSFFAAAIAPGTPLARAVRLTIRGEIRLGGRWMRFRSHEVLAPTSGLVWWGRVAGVVSGGDYAVDGAGRLEWRLLGLRRVAFAEGPDVVRSGLARAVAEGCLWAPTAVHPCAGVTWTADDDRVIHATATTAYDTVVHRITLGADDRVVSGVFDRWGDPDETGTPALHPFGGEATDWATFDGVAIATRGLVGWRYGTDRWPDGAFFRYEVTGCELLGPAVAGRG